MTTKEFSKIAENKLFNKIIDFASCIAIISLSIFFQIKFYSLLSLENFKTNSSNVIFTSLVFFTSLVLLMALGFYGLVIIIKPLKISYLENQNTKDENLKTIEKAYHILKGKDFQVDKNTIQFIYQKNFWSYKHRINFLVENNLVAIYVNNIDSNPKGGFLDFGSRSRLQKKILKIIENKCST
jgi:hypothetical protein